MFFKFYTNVIKDFVYYASMKA